MKKVARLRFLAEEKDVGTVEQVGVRTTGRIKKPKAVFDPSDNYTPRSYRSPVATAVQQQETTAAATPTAALDRKRDPEPIQNKRLLSQSSAQSTSSTASLTTPPIPADTCYICFKKEIKRGVGARNKLIACIGCDFKVHKMCLKIDFENYEVLRSTFKCDNCRSCTVCSAFSEIDAVVDSDLVTCTKCVKSYHLTCHIPNVQKYQKLTRNWKCNKCTLPITGNGNALAKQAIREIIGDESNISPKIPEKQPKVNIAAAAEEAKNSATKRTFQATKNTPNAILNGNETEEIPDGKTQKREDHSSFDRYIINEPLDIPDVKQWTVDQVTEYFAKYFPKEAYVFKEHEIDGMSLLLLKRSDIVKKLPIKLGPSLRIYSLILKIQTQLNDATLGWNCGI